MVVSPAFKSNFLPPFSLDAALDQIKHRHRAFKKLEAIFKSKNINPSTGWEPLREKIKGGKKDSDDAAQCIVEIYKELLLIGPRAISVYRTDDFDWNTLMVEAAALVVDQSDFQSSYPLPLDQSQLSGLDNKEPKLVEIRQFHDGDLALIFSAVREFDDKQDFPKAQIPAALADQMAHIDRLVGYFRVCEQAFDVAVLSVAKQRLELRLDARAALPLDQYEALTSGLLNQLSARLPRISQLMASPINFFPAIREICDDEKQGMLESLWFTTHTGLINKLRMKEPDVDLRTEKYHHGGLDALGQPISPYHLTVGFRNLTSAKNEISITLPGRIKDLSSLSPMLRLAIFEGAISNGELSHGINRLISLCPVDS